MFSSVYTQFTCNLHVIYMEFFMQLFDTVYDMVVCYRFPVLFHKLGSMTDVKILEKFIVIFTIKSTIFRLYFSVKACGVPRVYTLQSFRNNAIVFKLQAYQIYSQNKKNFFSFQIITDWLFIFVS